jgi:hypothetical protein
LYLATFSILSNEKLLEVQEPSKKQHAIPGFLRFDEQTVSWLYEGAHAMLEMLFSKRFLAAGGKNRRWILAAISG